MARRIEIRYGQRRVEAEAPAHFEWMETPGRSTAPATGLDVVEIVRGLDAPVAGPALAELVNVDRIGIVLPDRTRSAGTDRILPSVLDHLFTHRRSRIGVTLIVGGGTHAPDDPARVMGLVPGSWPGRLDLVIHDARDDASLVEIGETSSGTPVTLNRTVLEQDLLIVTGSVGFHYFAGFGGGRKGIFPGLAGYESVRLNHRLVMDPTPGQGLHPSCRPGRLDGNPMHLDALEAVRLLRQPTFLVNSLASSGGGVADVVTGEIDAAHREGCRRYAADRRATLPRPADLVVADSGGHPRDIDLIQSHKALAHLAPTVRDGGVVILVARCGGGVGSRTFMPWFDHGDARTMEGAIRADYQLNAHTALSFRKQTERVRLLLVTDLDRELVVRIGGEPHPSLDSALNRARELLPGGGDAVVIPSPTEALFS